METQTTVETPQETVERPVAGEPRQRSIGQLIKELSVDMMTLVREEMDLAKAEMTDKAKTYTRNSISVVAGGLVAYSAFVVLLAAIVAGLWVGFNQIMPWNVSVWLSPLIVSIVVGIIGYVMINKGIKTIRSTPVKPQQTVDSLRENKEWLKHQAR